MDVRKRLSFGLFVLAFIFISAKTYDTNAKIKAVFLYNFTKYIEWPKEQRQGTFVFGIMGDSPLYTELSNMAKTKQASGLTIEVKKFSSIDQLTDCHILYVPTGQSSKWENIQSRMKTKSTLLVTEEPGLASKGATINFVVKDNRQKFELNLANAQKQGLKISSSLEALAILVN
jgi:hypothetical protein